MTDIFGCATERELRILIAFLVRERSVIEGEAERLLTDLYFIQAASQCGLLGRLVECYEEVLACWPEEERDSVSGRRRTVVPDWIGAAVAQVLAGGPDVDIERGAGPVLKKLRKLKDSDRHCRPAEPIFDNTVSLAEGYFGSDQGASDSLARSREALSGEEADGADDATPRSRIEAFAVFVSTHGDRLARTPEETITIARNYAREGPVSIQADSLAVALSHPWLAREPRPMPYPRRPLLMKRLEGHPGGVTAVALASGGHLAISGGAEGTLKVWDLPSGACRHAWDDHGGAIQGVVLTSDGRRAVSCGKGEGSYGDTEFRVWDIELGVRLLKSEGNRSEFTGIAVSSDGRIVVGAHGDGVLRVWDGETGKLVRAMEDGGYAVTGRPSVSADGRLAACVAERSRTAETYYEEAGWEPRCDNLVIYDVATGGILRVLSGNPFEVSSVVLTSNGCLLFSGGSDNAIRVWDVESGSFLQDFLGHVDDQPPGLRTTMLVRTADGNEVEVPNDSIKALAATSDGRVLISTSKFSRSIRLWDVQRVTVRPIRGHGDVPSAIDVSDDGGLVISGEGSQIYLWNVATGVPARELVRHEGAVYQAKADPTGQQACSVDSTGEVAIWDTKTGEWKHDITGQEGRVRDLDASRSGDRKAVVTNGFLYFLETGGGDCQTVEQDQELLFNRVCLTREGHLALTAESDNTMEPAAKGRVRVWDAATGECRRTLGLGRKAIGELRLARDDRTAVVSCGTSLEYDVRLVDVVSGVVVRRIHGAGFGISKCALTPDGHSLVGACSDLAVRVWDVVRGVVCVTLWGHSREIQDTVVTPTGWQAVTAASDGTLRVWDLRGGQCQHVLRGHVGAIRVVRTTCDGELVASAGEDGTIRVWDLTSGRCVSTYYVGGPISARAFWGISPEGTLICGSNRGEMHFLKLRRSKPAVPWVTGFYVSEETLATKSCGTTLADSDSQSPGSETDSHEWGGQAVAVCPACAAQWQLRQEIQSAIEREQRGTITAGRSPCAELALSAWHSQLLRMKCPECHGDIQLNPFLFYRIDSSAEGRRGSEPCFGAEVDASRKSGRETDTGCVYCGKQCDDLLSLGKSGEGIGRECLQGLLYSREAEWAEFAEVLGMRPCCVCGDIRPQEPYVLTAKGWLCAVCVMSALENTISASDFAKFSAAAICERLDEETPLYDKLAVLVAIDQSWERVSCGDDVSVHEFCAKLVGLLGYRRGHPLDRHVRGAAMSACGKVGKALVPELLRRLGTCRRVSWEFYWNVTSALIQVDRGHPRVEGVVREASRDPERAVRVGVAGVLGELDFPWVGDVLKNMASDREETIREIVRASYSEWTAKRREERELRSRPSKAEGRRASTVDAEALPAREELEVLPRSAAAALVARCAARLELSFSAWPKARQEHLIWVNRGVEYVRWAAANGEVEREEYLEDELRDVVEYCETVGHDARIAEDDRFLEDATVASIASKGVLLAVQAAGAADPWVFTKLASESVRAVVGCVTGVTEGPRDENRGAVVAMLWKEYEELRSIAESEQWDAATPVRAELLVPRELAR